MQLLDNLEVYKLVFKLSLCMDIFCFVLLKMFPHNCMKANHLSQYYFRNENKT